MPEILTIDSLAEEMRPLFGQVVLLYRSELAILEGVGIDMHDLYYIARPFVGAPGKPVWYSAVGHCESLKEHLPEEMYQSMLSVRALNRGIPDAFVVKCDLEGEILDYDPEMHPGLLEEIRKKEAQDVFKNLSDLISL